MAGEAGIGPAMQESKSCALTAWRFPYMVADSGLEPERITAPHFEGGVSANSTNPAYEKPPEGPAAESGSLIQFGELYTIPGKQNRLLRFRARFFEGLISRVLYLKRRTRA